MLALRGRRGRRSRLAMCIRGGRKSVPRSAVWQSPSITQSTDVGVTVTLDASTPSCSSMISRSGHSSIFLGDDFGVDRLSFD